MALTRPFPVDSGFPLGLDLRRELAGIVPREGVFPDPVTIATAGIAYANGGWNVGAVPFVAAVRRGYAPFTQNYGTALVANDASGTAWTIPAAPATGSRIDLLWIRATDPSQGEATSGNDGPGGVARAVPVFGVTAGTAATTPTAPPLPAGVLEIARVTTAAGAASITASTFSQTYTFAHLAGARVACRNLAAINAIASPLLDDRALDLSTGITHRYNGTTWKAWESDWLTTAPTVTSGTGAFGSVSCAVAYKYTAGAVHLSATITITTAGTATGAIFVPLPVAAITGGQWVLAGRETGATGSAVTGTIMSGATTMNVFKYDNAQIIGNGYIVTLSGTYRPA